MIGSGGGGAVVAKELGERGLKVLVLEAGPWYGNARWPAPNDSPGARFGAEPSDLHIGLLREQFNKREDDMNNLIAGKLRWGPSDRGRPPWFRNVRGGGFVWQNSGVGGTTQSYLANSPRAYPSSVDGAWPIPYRELIPYYEQAERTLPVAFAPTTSKEELFYFGARKAGWRLIPTLDVTGPGYRPQPNAILPPNPRFADPDVSTERLSHMEGCTLAGHCINGCPHGPSVDRVAKRSTLVSYVPLALRTGNVAIRPNAFATRILTEAHPSEGQRAIGVRVRDTWTGETEDVRARVVVMAAGAIESPRLWLNSGLPRNRWVGKGLCNHYLDWVTGMFTERELLSILGSPSANPFAGHTSGARLDVPGLGSLLLTGLSPGLTATLSFGITEPGGLPGIGRGRAVGPELQYWMERYRTSLSIAVIADDEPDPRNGIEVDPRMEDEHGPVPVIAYVPTPRSRRNREALVGVAVDILRKAGAVQVHRANWPASLMIHMESTMRMGHVVDVDGEAYQTKRLYIADNSMHYNAIGGVNPTLTTQALAVRTAEKLVGKYFQ